MRVLTGILAASTLIYGGCAPKYISIGPYAIETKTLYEIKSKEVRGIIERIDTDKNKEISTEELRAAINSMQAIEIARNTAGVVQSRLEELIKPDSKP